jgi:hypothetical protein
MWEDCLWIYVFPMLEHVSHLVSIVELLSMFWYFP